VLGPLELDFVDGLWLFARWVFGLVVGGGIDLVLDGLFVLGFGIVVDLLVPERVAAVAVERPAVGLAVALSLRTHIRLVYRPMMTLLKLLGFSRLLLVVLVRRHPQKVESY